VKEGLREISNIGAIGDIFCYEFRKGPLI